MNTDQQLRYLELENAKLRAEAAQLRKKIGENSRHARRIEQAYQDAILFVMWRVAHIAVDRNYAKSQGITQNRYQNALALLRIAGLVTRHHTWCVEDLETANRRLQIARDRAKTDKAVFYMRHPRHRHQC